MQAVRLLKKSNPAVLERQVQNRDLRAAAYFPFGCYEAITFTHELGPDNYEAQSLASCEPPDCIAGIHIGGFLSHEMPVDVVAFGLLDPVAGGLAETLDHLTGTDEQRPDGVVTAFSPLLGSCDLRVIVEVMGPTEEATLGHLQLMIDARTVAKACTLLTFGELTWGFGEQADPLS